MVALTPSLSVADERGIGLLVQPPPVPLPGFRLETRHLRNERDVAVDLLAAEIRRLLKEAGYVTTDWSESPLFSLLVQKRRFRSAVAAIHERV